MEYDLYDRGNFIGRSAVVLIDNCKVIESMAPRIWQLKDAAKLGGVELVLAAGLRTFAEQLTLRRQNVIDKTKIKDEQYLLTADSSAFSPRTGKPGWSNHQDGMAYDFNVTKKDKSGVVIGTLPSYTWLVIHAFEHGFIRTVQSERWHWEYIPSAKSMFEVIPKNDPTWDGLV